jgi:hypothetical protein
MRRSLSPMIERWITALHTENAGPETPAETRDRLKDRFPKNATRRMTQLGLLVGAALEPVRVGADDALVYASCYAETLALEGYLDSFPTPSPTLFQTSIHPSAVQQALIIKQQPLRQFIPLTGGKNIAVHAVLAALLTDTSRTLLCGGEERGTWLLEQGYASDRTFAFALALSTDSAGAIGRISIAEESVQSAHPVTGLSLPDFFDLLNTRGSLDAHVLPGRRLVLSWL